MTPTPTTAAFIHADLSWRARSEYLEMPGLRLTIGQAARLFGLDHHDCASILENLVTEGFLYRTGERYARTNIGRRCA